MKTTYAIVSEGDFTKRDKKTCVIKEFNSKDYLVTSLGTRNELMQILFRFNTKGKYLALVDETSYSILSIITE